jgi:hypothetical protein
MKKITNILRKLSFIVLSATLLFSCSKEEEKNGITTPAPKIESLELGHENSKIGYIGDDVHIEALFSAEGMIKETKLQITYANGESSFKIEEISTEFVDKKGGKIHKHVDIPADAKEGNYDFLFSVTDQNGQTTSVKEVLKVEKKRDFTENEALSLATLQLGVLNKSIALKKDDFIAKFSNGNVVYEQTNPFEPLVYYATTTREGVPFQKYKIEVSFGNVFDLDVLPFQTYEGVDTITITPIDETGEEAKNDQPKEIFEYFEDYITFFSAKPYQYIREEDNIGYSVKSFTKEEFYRTFSNKELKETDAEILWNANPNKPAAESSKKKNTPIVKLKYKRETNTYGISLEFNRPNDYTNNLKQN